MDWAQILVIILSIFLALFLLLGIVLIVLLIRLTQQIRSVTASAQRTASGIEGVVSTLTKFSSPGVASKVIFGGIKKLRKNKGK